MKVLLVGEFQEGRLLETTYELFGFASAIGAESSMVLVGSRDQLPSCDGTLYFADAGKYGEYNPDLHKKIVLQAVEKENPDYIVFLHSSYGWDLAPRVAAALRVAQISEVIGADSGVFEVGSCNAKMHRAVKPRTGKTVITLQAGAFPVLMPSGGSATVEEVTVEGTSSTEFSGYVPAEHADVDLSKADIVVSAGRGVGKMDDVSIVRDLARALGGELGASRPVVDAGWLSHSHQVGSTGQTVTPKVYVACGISGAIQHLASMKKSGYIMAVNKDKDAPIGEVADLLVVADLHQFLPALTAKLSS